MGTTRTGDGGVVGLVVRALVVVAVVVGLAGGAVAAGLDRPPSWDGRPGPAAEQPAAE